MNKSALSPLVRFLAGFLLITACFVAVTSLYSPMAMAQAPASGPKIWLQSNQPLPVQHVPAGQGAMTANPAGISGAQPVSMAAADLDADGFQDLVVGYSSGGAGFISIHRGNIDAFAPQSDASFQAIGRGEFPAPFQLEAQTFSVPVSPDFIALGDFLGSGNQDLAIAARGGNTLYVFPGDGKGNFGAPQGFALPGAVNALAAGRFGASHLPTLVLGLGAGKNFSLALYAPTPQGFAALGVFPLSGAASNILFGDFRDSGFDIAFLSNGKVQILRPNLQLTTVPSAGSVSAFALGSFVYDRTGGQQIALLTSDGSVHVMARSDFDPRVYTVDEIRAIRRAQINHLPPPAFVPMRSFPAGWNVVESFPSVGSIAAGQAPVFFQTRVSSNGADDVMWLNAGNGQMAVISHPDVKPGAQTFVPGQVSIKSYNGSPMGALPLRINVDGRPGVLAIHGGEVAPSMLMPIPDPTFTVNRFDDPTPVSPITNACNGVANDCSLREAVLRANALAGTDTISLPAGTYTLTLGRTVAAPAVPPEDATTGTLNINDSVNIIGANQNTTIITWGTPTPGGSTVDMVISVNEDIQQITNATASISNVTIQNGVNHGSQSGFDGDGGCMEFDTGTNGTATLTLTNVTLQNCSTVDGGGGGLVIFNFVTPAGAGGATISNSIIQGNSVTEVGAAGNGGGIAINFDAHMTMTASQVLNNRAVEQCTPTCGLGDGGGIITFAPQNVSAATAENFIHSSTISGNKSAGFGGGIENGASLSIDQGTVISGNIAGTDGTNNTAHANQEGGGIYTNEGAANHCPNATFPAACAVTLSKVTITGNSATGNGGGISHGNASPGTTGTLTMSFSRLAGNSTSGGSGSNLNNNNATATVTNNWWGTNAAAGTINTISGTTTFDPFIVLTHTSSPNSPHAIKINQSATLTGDMSKDNHGNGAALSGNLDEIVGLPITFAVGTPVLGSIPQAQPETLGNPVPTATATFNAGGTAGLAKPTATVDQATVTVNSNLIASATESGTIATITTVGLHGFSTSDFVTIAGVTGAGTCGGYNGNFFPITGVTPTTFTYTAPSGLSTCGSGTASVDLPILEPPSITKTFGGTKVVKTNTANTITFSITNGNVIPIDASFTDNLPSNVGTVPGSLVVATTPNVVNNCNGTVTATAGSGTISFSNAALAAGTCTIKVDVQSSVDNLYSNSVTIDSTVAGNGNTSSDTLNVINPPGITKNFGAATIPLNGTTSLIIQVSNPNQNQTLSGITFTDTLPNTTGTLVVATPNALTNNCSGTATATAGSGSVSLASSSLAPGSSCTVALNVTGTAAGVANNSVTASDTTAGAGAAGTASVTIVAPPVIIKAFGAASIPLNGSTSLSFTIQNNNTTVALSGVAFTDTLPAGLVISTPNGLTGSCGGGTITATAGTNVISLSGGTIAASSSCTFSVNVTGIAAGQQNNTTGNVTSTEGGTGGTASASLTVEAPPSIAKVFTPNTIPLNATTSLTFTITNPVANVDPLTGVAFSDTLPTGLTVANATSTVCGGTLTTTAPTGISLSGATIAAGGQCQFSVTVTGAASGQYTNTTGAVSSTNGGTGNTASANLTVASPPTIAKAFGAATIPLNGTTSLTFNITNPNTGVALTGVAFTDNLPAGLVVATPNGLTNSCGGTVTAVAGSGSVSLSGGTVAASASCAVSVNVQGTTAGVKNNSVQVTSTEGGTGNTSNASITVAAPPVIIKAFGAASIPLNGSTSLSFTIQNNNSTVALSGVAFTDTLPAGLVVSTPNGLTGSCGAGTITATAGTNVISLSGGTIAASGSCTFSVNVTGIAAGSQNNTTGNVTSTEGGTGGTASASVTVVAPPSIAKAFNPSSIPLNGTTSLTFTITNPAANTVTENGVAFTDALPSGLVVGTPNNLINTCGGTATATAGSGTISLTGGTVAVNSTCSVSVSITGTASGLYTNTSGPVSSTNGGTGNTATANLSVASPPTITKAFGAAQIPVNGTTSLTFNITNPNTNVTLTGLAFTDSFPAGIVVGPTPGVSNTCGGTVTATAGAGSASLSGGTLASGASCTVSLTIQGTTAGIKNNSVQVTSTEGGPGNTSNASITVVAPPVIIKAFGAASIPLNGSTSLSFTIQNNNSTVALSGIGFSDTLPSGLVISTPNGLTGSCGGGTITATAGTGVISLSGASLAASTSCTFAVNVTGTSAGLKTNTTGNVTSTEGGTGGTATAFIHVQAPPSIAKAFNPALIAANGVSTLTFTITNPAANVDPETGVAFTDTLPANVVVATPNGLSQTCGGTVTATAGTGSISLTGGTVAVASSCTVGVNVTSGVPGTYVNTSGAVSSTNGGTGNTASATLTVAHANLTITKTHQGTFHRGQTGAVWTITVGASATGGPTDGTTVTVTDTLPNVQNPPVATAISGTGWTCTLATLTCTRSDVLAPGASYPAINLTVNIPQSIVNHFTNTANVSGGGDPNSHQATDDIFLGPPLQIKSMDTGTATVSDGSAAMFQFQVDASGVAPLPTIVSFSCSGLPKGSSCIFTHPDGTSAFAVGYSNSQPAGQVNMTVTSIGKSAQLRRRGIPPMYAALLFPVAGLVSMGLAGRKRKGVRARLSMIVLGLLVMVMAALAGCGGGSLFTPQGQTNITVTATTTSAQGQVSATATVQLTLQ